MLTTKWIMGFENLDEVHRIRNIVFIKEQNVKEDIEFDGTDADAIHLLLLENDIPVGTGRIILVNDDYRLGRIAVLKEHRGKGYGREIVRQLIKHAYKIGGNRQYLHAQISVIPFYESLGFHVSGNEFKEAGIRHIKMSRTGDIE